MYSTPNLRLVTLWCFYENSTPSAILIVALEHYNHSTTRVSKVGVVIWQDGMNEFE